MKNPVIADNKPVKVELTEGEEYYFCTCGKSKNQPFCDGSHAGTGFKPKSFVAEETGDAYLCRCKYSNVVCKTISAFVTGTHKQVYGWSKWVEGKALMVHHPSGSGPISQRSSGCWQTRRGAATVEFIHQISTRGGL
ncbi:UNVERIFIED_CONTAM: hypothetical protein GTU68_019213 [Idotea baltica]|nr:hypothetical protein [Idotea baltica]